MTKLSKYICPTCDLISNKISTEERAIIFATLAHSGQKRKYTGEPYVHHPLGVANILRTVPHTESMIVAAILHDVVEDTDVTIKRVRESFGDNVANLVYFLTDISREGDGNRSFRKEIDRRHIACAPIQAKTIKLADLIHNSESIVEHDEDFAKVYMREKRLLLDEALVDGDYALWLRADGIVQDYFNRNQKGV